MSPLMTIKEVSEYLGISTATFYREIKGNFVPVVLVGRSERYHRDAVTAWIANGGSAQTAISDTDNSEIN